jgi:alpha-beta hydrolase superfamily lysophospholipase
MNSDESPHMSDGNLPQRAAQPIAFADTIGLFMPAGTAETPARLAVLFASPWGLEELSVRKLWRITAERLAGHGIPSLRFDYPGTGDALDPQDGDIGLATWVESLVTAAEKLKVLSGCGRIAIIAEGLGCVIAARAAASVEGLEAVAFLAPVVSGRMHLRELALWSSVVDDNLGLALHQRSQSGVSIGSLTMPAGIADELRRVNLMTLEAPPANCILVASRPERPSDGEFAARLGMVGADVSECAFDGYQALVANPTTSVLPMTLVEEVVDWISALPVAPHPALPRQAVAAGQLAAPEFIETPVRFGGSDHLVGILCEPQETSRPDTVVLFLTSAYDRHSGWGRSTVNMARQLAGAGIPSLRFDTAGVADSPPIAGRPAQVLYHDSQIGDVSDALDFLRSHNFGRICVSGRCSGAYLAFRSALQDERIAGVIAVNPAVFRWQPGRSVDDAVVNGTRSLEDYGRRAFNGATLKRIFSGQVDLAAAISNIAGGVSRRLTRGVLHAIRFALPEGREIREAFETLHRRGMPLTILYSDGDLGLEQYSYYFGRDGRSHAQWKNVSATIIPDADHNLTPPEARQIYLDAVTQMVGRLAPETPRSEGYRIAAAE